jgi:hypothetical protein
MLPCCAPPRGRMILLVKMVKIVPALAIVKEVAPSLLDMHLRNLCSGRQITPPPLFEIEGEAMKRLDTSKGISDKIVRSTFVVLLFFAILFPRTSSAQWVQTSGPLGGMVRALTVSGTNVFAGTFGGVYLSINGGAHWTPVNSGFEREIIYSLISNSNGSGGTTIYAGTGGDGLLISTNNGTSWRRSYAGMTNFSVYSLAVSGTRLFAGTVNGVFTSSDNGTSWTLAGTGLTGSFIYTLLTSGSSVFAGTSSGVYVTTNNGTSWTPVNTGLPNAPVNSFVLSGNNLFAGTSSGVFLSSNSGASWTSVNAGLSNGSITALAVSSNGQGGANLFAASFGGGVFLSTNNGSSWTAVNSGITNPKISAIVVSTSGTGTTTVFAGGIGGLFVSTNSGTNWTEVNSGLLCSNPGPIAANGTNLLAGTEAGIFMSTNSGNNWARVGLPSELVTSIVINGSSIFAGTYSGVFVSTDNGTSWNVRNTGLTNTSINYLLLSGSNLFAASQGGGVSISTNNGASWTTLNAGLTNTIVYVLATNGSDLYAGTYGGVFRSTNSGSSWVAVNTGLTSTMILSFAVRGGSLYAGTSNGGIFVSSNSGASWSALNTGLPSLSIYDFAVSGTTLIAATYNGVSVLTNGASRWITVSSGLSNTAMSSFCISGTTLYAGTSGTGVWKRPLWEITDVPPAPTPASPLDTARGIPVNATLSWGALPGPITYAVEVSTTPTFATTVLSDSNLTATARTIGALSLGTTYYWRVKAKNELGWGAFSTTRRFTTTVTSSVENLRSMLPKEFELGQNYPNPFNPSTVIRFAIPQAVHVQLEVFDILGRSVATLVSDNLEAGSYFVPWSATNPSGLYFYRLEAGTFTDTKRMTLLK